MKHMKPITQSNIPSPEHEKTGQDIDIYSYIHIQSSAPSIPTTSNPPQPIDSITVTSCPSSIPSSTPNYKQTSSSSYSSSYRHLHSLSLPLNAFLHSDSTSKLSEELEKWKGWSIGKGYIDSRIIEIEGSLYLIAISEGNGKEEEGHWDIYKLPYHHGQGGLPYPVLVHTFTSRYIHIFKTMLKCKNVSRRGYDYCGFCPRCLAYKSNSKVFAKKLSEIQKLEGDIEDLKKLEKGNGLISSQQRGLAYIEKNILEGKATKLRKRIEQLKKWAIDPSKYRLQAELRLLKLQQNAKVLQENVKLAYEPHYFISLCTPTTLHELYNAQDAWGTQEGRKVDRRHTEGLKRILKGLGVKEGGFSDTLRCVFRKLMVEAVEDIHEGMELTYEQQMHPCNKYDLAPDIHFLIRKTVVKDGVIEEVPFDIVRLKQAVECKMKRFVEVALMMIDHWYGGCRASAFENWEEKVLEEMKKLQVNGIPVETVDIQVREPRQLLSTHKYLRRYPTENISSLYFNKKTGVAKVWYWNKDGEKEPAEYGLLDLLWRCVGFDGRKFGVRYSGDYQSTKLKKRVDKLEEHKEVKDKSPRDSIATLKQEMRDRHATIDGGSSGKVSEILPSADLCHPNIKEFVSLLPSGPFRSLHLSLRKETSSNSN